MKTLQIIDHGKKTYYYADKSPQVLTDKMTMTKTGFHTPESSLKERGYTEIFREKEMLRQMGKMKEIE